MTFSSSCLVGKTRFKLLNELLFIWEVSQPTWVGSHLILSGFHLGEMKICHMKMCRWVSPAKWDRFFFKTHAYDLIESMQSFKASMTFKNLDFNADKATQYSVLQETMAAIYCDDETLLVPLRLQIGLRTLVNCHRKIRLQWKKRSKYKKTCCWVGLAHKHCK